MNQVEMIRDRSRKLRAMVSALQALTGVVDSLVEPDGPTDDALDVMTIALATLPGTTAAIDAVAEELRLFASNELRIREPEFRAAVSAGVAALRKALAERVDTVDMVDANGEPSVLKRGTQATVEGVAIIRAFKEECSDVDVRTYHAGSGWGLYVVKAPWKSQS